MTYGKPLRVASASLILFVVNACSTAQLQISLPAGTLISGNATLARAGLFLDQADYGLAIDEYRKVLRDTPDSAAAIQGLAICYDRLQRFDLSDRYFQEALALSPRDQGVYLAYAASLRSQGRTDDAANLSADMQSMLAANESLPNTRTPVAMPAFTRSVDTAVLALPPAPAEIADPAATGTEGSYLERVSLSEVRLVTYPKPTPSHTVTIDISRLMAAPLKAPRATKIVNAVGKAGIAARYRRYLLARGWVALDKGDAAFRLASSKVLFPPANQSEALRLVRALPFPATAVPMPKADRILVLIGRDALGFDHGNMAERKS